MDARGPKAGWRKAMRCPCFRGGGVHDSAGRYTTPPGGTESVLETIPTRRVLRSRIVIRFFFRVLSYGALKEPRFLLALNPFRTAVPFWGQNSQILSNLSLKRDCSPKRVMASACRSFLSRGTPVSQKYCLVRQKKTATPIVSRAARKAPKRGGSLSNEARLPGAAEEPPGTTRGEGIPRQQDNPEPPR